jgi:flagellar hook-length control protein FliK
MSSASPPIRSPAKAIASSRDEANFGGAAGGAGEGDSVARIGAALASVSRRATPFAGAEKSPVEAEVSLAAPDAAATYPIHVVAQKAWLQPVSPAFSPGLNRLAAADRAALEAPRAGKSAAPESRAEAAAANVPEAAPAARAEAAPLPSNAVAFSGGAAFFVDEDSAVAALAAKKPTVAPENASALPQAAAPRRDLEITLAPKDLGGLAVRIKSAGDRLELAFVADKGETARMISDKSATLESQLHGAGLGLGGIEIDAASRTDLGALGAPLASAGATANGAPADPRENSQSAPQRQEFSGRGRQDQSHETGEKSGEPLASSGNRGLYL